MKSYFNNLFRYDKWATQQLLSKFDYQPPINQRIYELLSHVLSAQQIWLDRCNNATQSVALWAERTPESLRYDTERYYLSWINYLDGLETAEFDKMVNYTNSKGDTFTTRLTDIIAHVINHGTHHRGEMLIHMKQEGFELPNIDYITFVRQ